jgi:uncharacterized protein YndB with AHSA1/START domain
MNEAARKFDTQDIVVEEVLPHAPETIWKALTTGELIGRWLHMTPTGFEPVKGKRFTFQTTPAGAWDGVIHCDTEPTPRLFLERRTRDKCRIRLAVGHRRHLHPLQG